MNAHDDASDVFDSTGAEIAIIGMAGRFPGADDVDAFWSRIRAGVESVTHFSSEAMAARGVPAELLADPAHVKSGMVLDGMDRFDAGYFGYTPRDVEQLDPQQRVFLETAVQALDHAGYGDAAQAGLTCVFAGCGANAYLLRHLLPSVRRDAHDISALIGLMNGNDKDSLATRLAYKLDLRGPAVTVQTACSTSLVAVHLACRSLLNHEADTALAGGVWLNLMQHGGYRHQAGSILSPDGHCRAFDADAAGTVIGSGAGLVVLKRLADALADGDTIHAVIKGSALNNDGAAKVGYTAPSIDGQAEVILAAQAMAEVPPDSIGYIEAHGTGTTLGDPIEIAALTQAFRAGGSTATGHCAIGSVKTNIGHLDAAAGVAGLIKAVMALKHRTLPPSLNFKRPNPQIDFATSPFYVNTEARPWPAGETPRRAGVSSFGMGGTNVHVVLQEAPAEAVFARPVDRTELLTVSARSAEALETALVQLAARLHQFAGQPSAPASDGAPVAAPSLRDIAHTLRVGRRRFDHRAAVLANTTTQAAQRLRERPADAFFSGQRGAQRPSVAFLFPGQGAQHLAMGQALYQREPVFRAEFDICCELLVPLGLDLRPSLWAEDGSNEEAAARLNETELTQPALFAIEYALARLWMSRGVHPDVMLGHSIGEYVAACLAGVFSLQDALPLIAARGRLLQGTAAGAMLSVGLPEAQLQAWLQAGCDLAAVNAEGLCVLSGSPQAIAAAQRGLEAQGVAARPLHVTRAFHSAQVEPVLAEFEALLKRVSLSPPKIPFISNLSGQLITAAEATRPAYWVQHLRAPVRFADGLGTLLAQPGRVLLEVGPGESLSTLARRHPMAASGAHRVLASQCHPQRRDANAAQFDRCCAQLWIAGIDTQPVADALPSPRRVPLPSYPFERQSYWIDAPAAGHVEVPAARKAAPFAAPSVDTVKPRLLTDWLLAPHWARSKPLPAATAVTAVTTVTDVARSTLILGDAQGLGQALVQALRAQGHTVLFAQAGEAHCELSPGQHTARPDHAGDLAELLRHAGRSAPVSQVWHLWSLHSDALERGFHSLMALGQALGQGTSARGVLRLMVVTQGLEDVTGTERLQPNQATLHGPCKVIPLELPGVECRLIDVAVADTVDAEGASYRLANLVRQLLAEAATPSIASAAAANADAPDSEAIAYRGPHRWLKSFEPVARGDRVEPRLRQGGVYLITGGLGGVGFSLARHLAQHWQAKLVLLTRQLSEVAQQRLQALEALGTEVLWLQADVADAASVQAALAQARARFGSLHGVIHAAGVGGGGLIAQRSREAIERVFAPKLAGTRHLLQALRDEPLDFMLLCSSLSAITGGFGQADYVAANAYLDAVATREWREGRPLISVNWDAWRELGMAAGQQLPEGVGIAPAQAGALLEALLADSSLVQVLVSTLPLAEQRAAQRSGQLAERLLAAPLSKQRSHGRPQLSTPYQAPQGEVEDGLAAMWSEFLGITPIGAHDNLFELGGDSLLAIQLIARIRSAYGVDLHPALLFNGPTVAELALQIETRLIEELEQADAQPALA